MFNKLILKVLLSISLSVAALSSANASLITQEILGKDDQGNWSVIGEVAVDSDRADSFNSIFEWESFSILGQEFWSPQESEALGLTGFFLAVIDTADLSSGIQHLNFDVTDNAVSTFAFGGAFDAGFDGEFFYDLFDVNGNFYGYQSFTLGQAVVSDAAVPEPQTALLLLTMLSVLMVRRKSL